MEAKRDSAQSIGDLNEPRENLSTPSSTPSTPSSESAEWEQLSTTGTDQSGLSAEFEVLKGYNRVPIYERRAQWLAEQQARREQRLQSMPGSTGPSGLGAFQPNSQLPFPITAQFLRYYGGNNNGRLWEQRRSPRSDDSQRTVVAPANYFNTPETSSRISPPNSSPSSPEAIPETTSFTQHRRLVERKKRRPNLPSRKTSGIPSFTSLFESKWNLDRNPKPKNSDYSPISREEIPNGDLPELAHQKTKLEVTILLDFLNKAISQLSSILWYWKSVFLVIIVSSISLTIFTALNTPDPSAIASSLLSPHNAPSQVASSHTQAPYADFPALMSVESSLERIVESATGGFALARLLKQGEMALSDLGTIVKHSDLSCKGTLGAQLSRFAGDAKETVVALQLFDSKIRGILDQVLEVNQEFLEEFTKKLKHQRRLRYTSVPFMTKNAESLHTRVWLSENFDRIARLLNLNIGTLVSSGKHLTKSLGSLSQQHGPIYEEIVREFVNIERRERIPWSRIGWESPRAGVVRKMRIQERKELLAIVGSYEEKARGYVENIRLEMESMMGEMETLQKRIAINFLAEVRENIVTEILLERQLEVVEQTVATMLRKRTHKARRACPEGIFINHKVKNETRSYQDIFTPTRTVEE